MGKLKRTSFYRLDELLQFITQQKVNDAVNKALNTANPFTSIPTMPGQTGLKRNNGMVP